VNRAREKPTKEHISADIPVLDGEYPCELSDAN
jgi:hypothetical protein